MLFDMTILLSERLTQFEKACLEHADMVISHPKTFCMPICKKIEANSTQSSEYSEYASELAHACICGMRFSSKTGLKQHNSLYCKKQYDKHVYGFKESGDEAKYEVDKIIDTRGNESTENRVYMVLWKHVLPGREDRKLADFDAEGEFEVEKVVAGPNSNFDGERRYLVFFKQYAREEFWWITESDLKEKASDALLDYLDSVKTLDNSKTPLKAFRTETTSIAEISWEPAAHMPKELIEEFWKSHPEIPRDEVYTTPDFYTPDTTDTESERLPLAIRCEYCGRKCENKQGLGAHQRYCFRKPVNRIGSKSDKYIQKLKQSRALKSRFEVVTIGDTEISTVDEFIYLGYMLRYDGNETPNLEMRFTKANTAFCCLRKIWSNTTYLPQELKIRVFNTFVLSVLLYASEVWTLDIKTRRSIRSWYSRKMSLITERSYRDECVSPTIDVIQLIRIRRAKWLKMNLTYNSKSLVVQVLRRQSLHNRTKGDVFSDMPNVHFDALKDKLNDDKEWEKIIESIKSDSAGDF